MSKAPAFALLAIPLNPTCCILKGIRAGSRLNAGLAVVCGVEVMLLLPSGVLKGSVLVDGVVVVIGLVNAGELVVASPGVPVSFPAEVFPVPDDWPPDGASGAPFGDPAGPHAARSMASSKLSAKTRLIFLIVFSSVQANRDV